MADEFLNSSILAKKIKPSISNDQLHIVTPGEVITSDTQYMRGHGTYLQKDCLIASVAGVVQRVNKLISVQSLHSRYTGEIGDVVVGRITDVAQKRWKVDMNSKQDGILMLSSINLPGGILRRKTASDELQMRKFFTEGDVLVAEVQAFYQDGSTALHTRSLKYGKLRNGCLVIVPPVLVKRAKSHFYKLPCGVDIILGLNGYLWVSMHIENSIEDPNSELAYSNKNELIPKQTRENISRVANCLHALSLQNMYIFDSSIVYCYDASLAFPIKEMLLPDNLSVIINQTKLELKQAMQL